MKLVYDGPQPTRTVELGPGNDIVVNQGEPFTVDPEIGQKLLRQRYFSETTGTTAAPTPATPAPKTTESASTTPAPEPSASAEKKGA
jgi:hypothetical protein